MDIRIPIGEGGRDGPLARSATLVRKPAILGTIAAMVLFAGVMVGGGFSAPVSAAPQGDCPAGWMLTTVDGSFGRSADRNGDGFQCSRHHGPEPAADGPGRGNVFRNHIGENHKDNFTFIIL